MHTAFHGNKTVLSIEPYEWDAIVSIAFDDASVEYYDRRTAQRVPRPSLDQNHITTLEDAGSKFDNLGSSIVDSSLHFTFLV